MKAVQLIKSYKALWFRCTLTKALMKDYSSVKQVFYLVLNQLRFQFKFSVFQISTVSL